MIAVDDQLMRMIPCVGAIEFSALGSGSVEEITDGEAIVDELVDPATRMAPYRRIRA